MEHHCGSSDKMDGLPLILLEIFNLKLNNAQC